MGDSRCISCVNGLAEALSLDHKPSNEEERSRIEQAGGFVEFNRVNGNLALSRAFGDFAFKSRAELPQEQQMITVKPDVVVRDLDPDLQFVVLACDGIWDVLSNQEVADFIIKRISLGLEPEIICEELMNRCLASDSTMGGLGCDNMTLILICFLHNQPYQHLIDECIEIEKIRDRTRQELLAKDEKASEDDEVDEQQGVAKETNGAGATEDDEITS